MVEKDSYMQTSRHSMGQQPHGPRLGNYELVTWLGRGGFAEVYLGRHIYLNTTAAVKILSTALTDEERYKFLEEAQRAAQLRHPHIVRVLEFGLEEDELFLVMEYAPNGTVRQRHPHGKRLSSPVVLKYVEQIADALDAIHSQGLIHRDIKPENLLLGPDNELLLSDFGIAIALHDVENEQVSVGTVDYMAPEQLAGQPCLASDQYALGVVVYEWLCGVLPFRGTLGEIIYQHQHNAPPSLRRRVPSIPQAVEQVVLRALAKDPQDRFESVLAFAEALRNAYEGGPTVPFENNLPQPQKAAQESWVRSNSRSVVRDQKQPKRRRKKTRAMRRREVWHEIATCYLIDLLVGAVLGGVLTALGVAALPAQLLLASCLLLLPCGYAYIKGNSLLFILTCTIALFAAIPALLAHELVLFVIAYIGLLLLALPTAFAVSINDV